MTGFDWLLLAVVAGGFAQGYVTGLIRQMASIVGIVAGLAFALALMADVGVLAAKSLGLSARVAPVVGFVLVFAVVQVAAFTLARLAETVIGAFKLTVLNRLGGAGVGALKAALLVSVLLVPVRHLSVPAPETRAASLLYEPVSQLMPRVWQVAERLLPRVDGLREQFDASAEALRERLPRD